MMQQQQANGNGDGAAAPADDSGSSRVAVAAVSGDARGKHRILAELKRLEQEARFLEEEVEELGRTEMVSASLQDLLHTVQSRPDPLLPLTNGPTNPYWDRWFEGPQDMHGCKCWIL